MDAYGLLRHLHWQTRVLFRKIVRSLPTAILDDFFFFEDLYFCRLEHRERHRLNRKINGLKKRREEEDLKRTDPINYYCTIPETKRNPRRATLRSHTEETHHPDNGMPNSFSFNPIQHSSTTTDISVSLNPASHPVFPKQSPLSLRDGWFVNLTDMEIPREAVSLLQLGERFCLRPPDNMERTAFSIIKQIESSILQLDSPDKAALRSTAVTILHKMASSQNPMTPMEKSISRALHSARRFIHEHPEIIFTRADKGSTTVAMFRTTYLEKMNALLADTTTYTELKKDPSNRLTRSLHGLLKSWEHSSYISRSLFYRLYSSDANLPRAYGLPKIHKQNYPLRIIISSIDSTLYALASYLHDIILKSLPPAPSSIKSSFRLVELMDKKQIPDGFQLISLDVVSLFTNVPAELVIKGIYSRWGLISQHTNLPLEEFVEAIKLVLNSTFFTFNGKFYQQTFGSPMGSPLSPIIADIVLQDLERRMLERLKFRPPFYFRYVDDIVMAAPPAFFTEILELFNSYHCRIKFTMEIGTDNTLNFLDVTMMVREGILEFDWYHKPTFSGRYLHYSSHQPISHKRGTFIGLVDRAFLLSHPRFHEKNLKFIITTLIRNGYPLPFLFQTIRNRLKFLFRKKSGLTGNSPSPAPPEVDNNRRFLTIPYIQGFSEQFKRVADSLSFRLAYSSCNSLRGLIKVYKDPLPSQSNRNVVYRIDCKDCEASYVGQTGRKLATRIKEHRRVSSDQNTLSVVQNHSLSLDHRFGWDDVKILDREEHYRKRLILEMLYIKRQKQGLNLQSDTELLDDSYLPVLQRLDRSRKSEQVRNSYYGGNSRFGSEHAPSFAHVSNSGN